MGRGNGKLEAVISSAVAEDFQKAARSEGSQMIWQIEVDRGLYAGKYVAHPIIIRGGRPRPMPYVLVADTLEELQATLPAGLERIPCTDPLVVENWIGGPD